MLRVCEFESRILRQSISALTRVGILPSGSDHPQRYAIATLGPILAPAEEVNTPRGVPPSPLIP